MGVEGVAGDDGVGEEGGGLLEEDLADGQLAAVLSPLWWWQRVTMAPGFAFAAGVLAVEGEGFEQEVAVGGEPSVDGAGERAGVAPVDDVVDGIVAGKLEQTAFLVAAGEAG